MKAFLHKNYHWVIAVVALLGYTVYGGIINNTASLYLIPVSEGLHASRTAVSLSASVRAIGAFLTNLSFGFFYKKFGFRRLASVGLLVIGLAFLGYASAKTVVMYIFSSVFIGLFDAFCSSAALSMLVNEWFDAHRGLVYGIITASSGFGGSLFCEILSDVMQKHGWRQSHVVSGVCLIAAALTTFLLIRSKPAEMGLKPYGEGSGDKGKKKRRHPDHAGMPMSRLIHTPTFYLMLAASLLSCCAAYFQLYVLVAHLQDQGFSAADAARAQSIMYLIMALTKILDGYFTDLVGARYVVLFSILCCFGSAWLLSDVRSMQAVWLPTVLFAIALPLTSILQPLSAAAIYGQRSYDTLVGIVLALACVASMIAMPVMNIFYEIFGSYTVAYRGVAILSLVSFAMYLVICRLADRDTKRYEQEIQKYGKDVI